MEKPNPLDQQQVKTVNLAMREAIKDTELRLNNVQEKLMLILKEKEILEKQVATLYLIDKNFSK